MDNKPQIEDDVELSQEPDNEQNLTIENEVVNVSTSDKKKELKGLGGWLIIVGISMFVSLIILGRNIYLLRPLFRASFWKTLSESSFGTSLKPAIIFELSGNIINILLLIVMIVLFFGKKRLFPKLAIGTYIFTVVVVLIDSYLVSRVHTTIIDMGVSTNIMRSIVAAGIWISYFKLSDRVKNTFVN